MRQSTEIASAAEQKVREKVSICEAAARLTNRKSETHKSETHKSTEIPDSRVAVVTVYPVVVADTSRNDGDDCEGDS